MIDLLATFMTISIFTLAFYGFLSLFGITEWLFCKIYGYKNIEEYYYEEYIEKWLN